MIKTTAKFSAKAIHVLHLIVRNFFILLTVLLSILFFWLIHGISIDRLDIGEYKIAGLYIKLDKKLTLMATEVTLPRSKAKPSFGRVDKTFDDIKYLLDFFDMIMLDRINFKNNHVTFLYADDVLYITSDIYEIAGNIKHEGEKLIADVSLLYIKKEEVTLSGSLAYDLKKSILLTEGDFEGFGIKGHFRVQKRKEKILYALNTEAFNTIEPLMSRISLPPAISVWITDKVRAKRYKVSYLTGTMLLDGENILYDPMLLQGKVHFDDVTIRYKEGVRAVEAEAMDLVYKEGGLYFSLIHPHHLDRKLDGSGVKILHIAGGREPVLLLDLYVQSPLDEEIQKILHAYKLHIPLYHNGKDDRVHIHLDIPLKRNPDGSKRKIGVLVDGNLSAGTLQIEKFPLKIERGTFSYQDGEVKLSDVVVDERWLKGVVFGKVDVKQKSILLEVDANDLRLGDILQIRKKRVPVKISYANGLEITLPSLAISLSKEKRTWIVRSGDLSRIAPYIRDNFLGISGGVLTLKSTDMRTFHYTGKVQSSTCFFYEKQHACYAVIPVSGYFTTTGAWKLNAFGDRLRLDLTKGVVQLNGINIDLKVLLSRSLPKYTKKGRLKRKFIILGKKSQLRYGPYRLLLDSYDIEIRPDGTIKAIGSLDGDIVKFTKQGRNIVIEALRIKDKMLRPLINFRGLKGGRYSLRKEGDPEHKMKGRILIEGGVLSDFKAYNNTLAFINTVPALATLNKPGFSGKGFKIKEGVIEYTMTQKKITFDSVYLKGDSATIVGTGTVDLKSGKLDINLAIQTVRELGKIVGNIPLLGYILLGDDNSMTVGLKITGTLAKPKVATSVAKDILTLPIQIIQRTITAPAHLVPTGTKGKKSSPPSKNVPQDEVQKGQ